MADFPITGAAEYIQYGWETTYGSASGTIDKAFGHNQKITVNRKANLQRLYGLGAVDASKAVAGIHEGKLTVEFELASTYFMKAVLGKVTDGGGGPYTHTFADNTGFTVTSLTIENGFDLDTDQVFKYLGCVVDRCTLRAAVGESVHVTLEFLYANETKATTGLDTSPATDAEEPMQFAEGALEMPNATVISRVQTFELEIVRNAQILYGLGNRTGAKAVWRAREWNFRTTVSFENPDQIVIEYGQAGGPLTTTTPAGHASLELTIDNAGLTTASRKLVFLLTTTFVDTDTIAQDVREHTTIEIEGFSLGVTSVIGTDNTAVTP